MVGLLDATTTLMKQRLCASLNVLGDAVTLGGKVSVLGKPPINLPNAIGGLVCDFPPGNLTPPPPPFTGGQCATNYTVNSGPYTRNTYACSDGALSFTGAGIQRGGTNIPGPIKFAGPFVSATGGCGAKTIVFQVIDKNDFVRNLGTLASTSSGSERVEVVGLSPVLTRSDGLADNCGNPPPIYPGPATNVPFSGDINYTTNNSTVINAPVTGIFAPIYTSFDGSLRIPVEVNVGGIELIGELKLTPNFTVNLRPKGISSGPGKTDPAGGAPGQPQVPVAEDVADVDRIVGVLVFSTLQGYVQKSTGLASLGGPTLHVPRLGSVQFAIKTANSIGWTSDIDVKNLESYIPCPAPQGAIAVRVTPITGVTRTFTPVRGIPLTSF